MSKPDVPMAFPCHPTPDTYHHGMTLRDYFAGQALAGFMANKATPAYFNPDDDAVYAYKIADAMLAERSK